MFSFFHVFLYSILVLAQLHTLVSAEDKCPEQNDISPCTCKLEDNPVGLQVRCEGASVTQKTINNVLRKLRSSNPNSPLKLRAFDIRNTSMTSLDLSPFIPMTVWDLAFLRNPSLNNFTAKLPPGVPSEKNRIAAQMVLLSSSPIEDSGVDSLMKTLLLDYVDYLQVADTRMTGVSPSTGELVCGLPLMTKLIWLRLDKNKIKRIRPGMFRKLTNLFVMDFSNNQITQLDAGAFDVGPDHRANSNPSKLFIDLKKNRLGDDGAKIEPMAFMSNYPIPVRLSLSKNNLATLDEKSFKDFFHSKITPDVYCRYNRFQCNSSMKWLKDRKEKLQGKINYVDCQNDPDQTVFTSTKIA